MLGCDLSIKSLNFIDFRKFRLGKGNTIEIIQNYFERSKYNFNENRHFVLKTISIKLVIAQKVLVKLTEISASHPNLIARYYIFLLRKYMHLITYLL